MIGASTLNLLALIRQGHELHISPTDDGGALVGELYAKAIAGTFSVRCVIAEAQTLEQLSVQLLDKWHGSDNAAGRELAALDATAPLRHCNDVTYCNARRMAGEQVVLCPYCANVARQLQLWDELPIGLPNTQEWRP